MFQGNQKKFELIGSSKRITRNKRKNSFYCTANILITFNCRKCQVKMNNAAFRLYVRMKWKKLSLNRACVSPFREVKLFHFRFETNNISLHKINKLYGYNTSVVSSMSRIATSGVKLYRSDLRRTKLRIPSNCGKFESFVVRVQVIGNQLYVGLNDLNTGLFMYMYLMVRISFSA